MRVLSVKIKGGHLNPTDGSRRNGEAVTLLISEPEERFEISARERSELLEAISEADRGEVVDGWKLLAELKG